MSKLFWFPTPLDSRCELTHDDDQISRIAVPDTHPTGRLGQSWELPSSLVDKHGARLVISHSNKTTIYMRGVLDLHYFNVNQAALLVDDTILPDG